MNGRAALERLGNQRPDRVAAYLRGQIEDAAMPEPNSGCWLWCRSVDRHGYGKIGGSRIGFTIGAHRAAWLVHRGEIPEGLHVLHRCDVRSCVNPDHLFLGTNADNVADRHAKGRTVYGHGERHYRAKLTDAKVIAILADKRRAAIIAAEAGVSSMIIYAIRKGKLWRHIPRDGA